MSKFFSPQRANRHAPNRSECRVGDALAVNALGLGGYTPLHAAAPTLFGSTIAGGWLGSEFRRARWSSNPGQSR
eukprot:2945746-Amphidinium_carterae.1